MQGGSQAGGSHAGRLTGVCKSSSRGSSALLWPPWELQAEHPVYEQTVLANERGESEPFLTKVR